MKVLAAVAVLELGREGGMPTQHCSGGHRHYATWAITFLLLLMFNFSVAYQVDRSIYLDGCKGIQYGTAAEDREESISIFAWQ